jgi:predicted HicB family RNase H-like nuclease
MSIKLVYYEVMISFVMKLPSDLHQAISNAAHAKHISMAEYVRRAVKEKLKKEEPCTLEKR